MIYLHMKRPEIKVNQNKFDLFQVTETSWHIFNMTYSLKTNYSLLLFLIPSNISLARVFPCCFPFYLNIGKNHSPIWVWKRKLPCDISRTHNLFTVNVCPSNMNAMTLPKRDRGFRTRYFHGKNENERIYFTLLLWLLLTT